MLICTCPIRSGKGGSHEPLSPDRCRFRLVSLSAGVAPQLRGRVMSTTMLSTVIASSVHSGSAASGSTSGVQS